MLRILENYKNGDLLYGLQSQRKEVIDALEKKQAQSIEPETQKSSYDFLLPIFSEEKPNKIPFTADVYNNHIIPRAAQPTWSTENEKKLYSALKNSEIPIDQTFFHQYYDAIKNPSYKKVSITNNFFPQNEKKLDQEQRQIRRACKAALLGGFKIHFNLSNIDCRQAFDRAYSLKQKKPTKLDVKCCYDSHTSAELRFVIKHYTEIQPHITFYYADKEIDLFDWLNGTDPATRQAIYQWAKNRQENLPKKSKDKIFSMSLFSENSYPLETTKASPSKRKSPGPG